MMNLLILGSHFILKWRRLYWLIYTVRKSMSLLTSFAVIWNKINTVMAMSISVRWVIYCSKKETLATHIIPLENFISISFSSFEHNCLHLMIIFGISLLLLLLLYIVYKRNIPIIMFCAYNDIKLISSYSLRILNGSCDNKNFRGKSKVSLRFMWWYGIVSYAGCTKVVRD